MSPERVRDAASARPSRADLLVVVAVFAALMAALLPVLPVVAAGAWVGGAVLLSALVLTAGHLARRRRLPAVAVSLIEAALWVVFMTGVFLRDTAIVWIIPSPQTVREVPGVLDTAFREITLGAAPLDATAALSFLVVGSAGLLAIVVDHVVLTARMPLLAAIGIIVVSLIPSIAVPGDVDVMAFVLLAAALLFLIRAETRSREEPFARRESGAAGVSATALGIGAIAVVVAVVATPLLPSPVARAGSSLVAGPGIDASLQLGDDLRRPQPIEMLRTRSDASGAPYLRATTLTRFDGAVWEPDRVRTVPLDGDSAFADVQVDEDIEVVEYTTTVEVVNLSSPWLPLSFPAVAVTGLEGSWAAVPDNRTVVAQQGTTQGQTYQVVSTVPRPTLEQIRAREATVGDDGDESLMLPEDLPPIIAETAAQVTAGTTNDYDAAIAMQRWFRSSEFRYSLSAPVEEGFDGSGAEAVARFLEVRSGYCIHFASAFALMARSLGMPTRIVVGFLPGVATQDSVDDQVVYSVPSSLLHSWPEVYFEGIGWVGFEPTKSLGTPTAFLPAASTPGQLGNPDAATPRPSSSSSASPGATPDALLDPRDDAATGTVVGTVNPLPSLGMVVGILCVLAIPGIVREARRRRLVAASRDGDSAAAWTTVQDAAIDLGIPVPASESPRAFAARLACDHGADPEAMQTLALAIERASYAPARVAEYWHGDEVTDAVLRARRSLTLAAPPARRLLAIVAPRSLIVRPGSAYAAGAGERAGAR